MLVTEWNTCLLGELGAPKRHAFATGPFGSSISKKFFVNEGVPVIRGSNLSIDVGITLNDEGLVFVDEEKARQFSRSIVRRGDLVFTCWGTIGQVGFISERTRFERYIVSNKQMKMTPDSSRVEPLFLYYILSSPRMVYEITSRAIGTSVPGFNLGQLKEIPVRLPPLAIQQDISRALRSFDDLIENNRQRIKILEEIARLLYREWFVAFRFPGHEDVELVSSDFGLIPEGWDYARLSDLVSTQYGYTESASLDQVGPRFLRGMDINKTSFIDWSSVPFCPVSEFDRQKFAVQVGDVFVIRMADPGKVGICEREIDAVFASYLVRLRPTNNRITQYYLFFTLNDHHYQVWVSGASTGATRKSISAKVMTEPSIVVPSTEILGRFDDAVRPLRKLMNSLLAQNAVLREARDLLLPRLVSGELDVSELDLELETLGV